MLKAAEAIREVVAASILTELRDPRVQDVTVVGVKVSPDMREAQIAVSIMGDESQQQLSPARATECRGIFAESNCLADRGKIHPTVAICD